MHGWSVWEEVSQINIKLVFFVINLVGTVKHEKVLSISTIKPVLHRQNHFFSLQPLLSRCTLHIKKQSKYTPKIPFDRLLLSGLDPKDGRVILPVFLDVVKHQLRLSSSTKTHDRQCSRNLKF